MTLLGLFLLGVPAGEIQENNLIIPLLAAAAAAVIIKRSTGHVKMKQIHGMLLLFIFALGAIWSFGVRMEQESKREALPAEGERLMITGTVTAIKTGGFVISSDQGRLLVRYSEETELLPGDGVCVTGEMTQLSAGTNPGAFDALAYYESEGIIGSVSAERVEYDEKERVWISRILSDIREAGKAAICRVLPEREAGVMAAMLLGEKAGVDKELKELYQKNGIAHILAISGLHVALLGGALTGILLKLGLTRRKASVITIVILVFYGFLTGFSPATLRAVIMITSVNLAGVFRRVSDLPTAMVCSLFLIILFQPWRVSSSGMLMSFLAVAGVGAQQMIYNDLFGKERFLSVPLFLRRLVKTFTGSVLLSFFVQLFLVPVMIRDYYSIAPYAVVLNLVVVPLLTVAVASGAVGMFLGLIPVFVKAGTAAALPCRWILMFYEWLCRGMQIVPGQEVVTGHISDEEMAVMLLLAAAAAGVLHLLLSGRNKKEKKWRFLFLTLAGVALCVGLFAGYGVLRNCMRKELIFFDVGQGDGCLLHAAGTDILFDFGSTSKEDPGDKILIPGLKYYGVTAVDMAVISHTDKDHVDGILELLEDGEKEGISTAAVCLAAGTEEDEMLRDILNAAERAGTEVYYVSAGDVIETDDPEVRLEVLYPNPGDTGSGNDYSLVISLDAYGVRTLFTGDIGAETEAELISVLKERMDPDILKVPHHGSAYSSSEEFLKEISKEGSIAVISVSRWNTYGHPAPSTLKRLQDAGFTIFRTDRNGAVIMEQE